MTTKAKKKPASTKTKGPKAKTARRKEEIEETEETKPIYIRNLSQETLDYIEGERDRIEETMGKCPVNTVARALMEAAVKNHREGTLKHYAFENI